jgi:hypothetical protein
MLTLLLLLALQVTTPGEMSCVGSVLDFAIPADLYVGGAEQEGTMALTIQGQLVFLNGPRVRLLKVGEINRVIRPEGRIHDPLTGNGLGVYHTDLGTIRIEAVNQDSATARVVYSCQGVSKGDIVVPFTPKPVTTFDGDLSTPLTPIPEKGVFSSVLLGKDDLRYLAAGQFCFIGRGWRDGVKPGDRFTIFRYYNSFDDKDMTVANAGAASSYSHLRNGSMNSLLRKRKLPPKILGDIVVVDVGDKSSAAKIISSLSEIYPGDLVVKR